MVMVDLAKRMHRKHTSTRLVMMTIVFIAGALWDHFFLLHCTPHSSLPHIRTNDRQISIDMRQEQTTTQPKVNQVRTATSASSHTSTLTSGVIDPRSRTDDPRQQPHKQPVDNEEMMIITPSHSSPPPLRGREGQRVTPVTMRPAVGESVGDRYVNLLDQYVDLKEDPDQSDFSEIWGGADMFMYEDGTRIPAQARRHCKSLFFAGSSISSTGIVVEFGSWIGHSSRCLGAGLNTTGLKNRLYSYDEFKDRINAQKLKGSRYENHPDANRFRFIWEETVLPVYPSAVPIPGRVSSTKFDMSVWSHEKVDVFVIDTAKTIEHWREQAVVVWPHLQVGSLLCLMDFVKTPQVELLYAQYVQSGDLEPVYIDFCASPWVFIVRKQPDWSKTTSFSIRQYDLSGWKAVFDLIYADIEYIAKKFNLEDQEALECVKGHVKKRWGIVTDSVSKGVGWK